jgi:hypothetical protein
MRLLESDISVLQWSSQSSWRISTSNGTLKHLAIKDWPSSTHDISFFAWEPVLLTECIDIWSPTLRKAIRPKLILTLLLGVPHNAPS